MPQFEESAHVFVNRHLEIGKLLWHGSDLGQNLDGSPVRVRPINDGSGSHRAFQVAYEQENTGMRIGILPQFNLILNVGLRLVIPESMDINDQTVALEFSSDIELRVES